MLFRKLEQDWVQKGGRPVRGKHVCCSSASANLPSANGKDEPLGGGDADSLQTDYTGLQALDFSVLIYGCAALYLPAAVYGIAAFLLSTSSTSFNTLGHYLPALLVKTTANNFRTIIGFHHVLLNVAFCCSIFPALRVRCPTYVRDHLLESSFMATLGLDLFPLFLQFGLKNKLIQFVCVLLSVAITVLGVYSSLNVLRISLDDRRDSLEARSTTLIWVIILSILGVCTREASYFLFIGMLVWLRWQRFKTSAQRRRS